MDKPFVNANVPLKSTLEVKVSGKGSADQQFFIADGTFELPDRSRETWTNTELRAGLTRVLNTPGTYVGRVDIHFVKSSTALLEMVVRDSKGNTVESLDEPPITQASDFDRTAMLLVVRSAAPAAKKAAQKKSAKKTLKRSGK